MPRFIIDPSARSRQKHGTVLYDVIDTERRATIDSPGELGSTLGYVMATAIRKEDANMMANSMEFALSEGMLFKMREPA